MDILSNRALQTGNRRHAFVMFLCFQSAASVRLPDKPNHMLSFLCLTQKNVEAFLSRALVVVVIIIL